MAPRFGVQVVGGANMAIWWKCKSPLPSYIFEKKIFLWNPDATGFHIVVEGAFHKENACENWMPYSLPFKIKVIDRLKIFLQTNK